MKLIFTICLAFIAMTSCQSGSKSENKNRESNTEACCNTMTEDELKFTSGGFSSAVINRPVNVVFEMLTNVNTWPTINLGVTKAILPENLKVEKGAKFNETIASPIPGIDDWTNEWTIAEYELDKAFAITGQDNFTKEPIHSYITYKFAALNDSTTLFKRTIKVTLNQEFAEKSSSQELEALYRFLGSQWEMATHLKKYVETNSTL